MKDMIQRLRYVVACLLSVCLLAVSIPSLDARADTTALAIIKPSPALSPEDVVEIQLLGLQLTQGRATSVEMQQVWAFAHPSNKAMTGPLARFARLFELPAYRPLLGHKTHEILRLAEREDRVQLRVQITAADGQGYVYLWIVGRARGGAEDGSWMTLSVSAPGNGGTQS